MLELFYLEKVRNPIYKYCGGKYSGPMSLVMEVPAKSENPILSSLRLPRNEELGLLERPLTPEEVEHLRQVFMSEVAPVYRKIVEEKLGIPISTPRKINKLHGIIPFVKRMADERYDVPNIHMGEMTAEKFELFMDMLFGVYLANVYSQGEFFRNYAKFNRFNRDFNAEDLSPSSILQEMIKVQNTGFKFSFDLAGLPKNSIEIYPMEMQHALPGDRVKNSFKENTDDHPLDNGYSLDMQTAYILQGISEAYGILVARTKSIEQYDDIDETQYLAWSKKNKLTFVERLALNGSSYTKYKVLSDIISAYFPQVWESGFSRLWGRLEAVRASYQDQSA